MKTNWKNISIIAVPTLIIGVLLGWLFFGSSSNQTKNEQQHGIDLNAENPKGTIWTCSMHPQIRRSEPGNCPICGMELIPLKNNTDEGDPMAISMSPMAMQLANVSTAIVGKTAPIKSVRLNGKVQADERLIYSQSSHIPGRIERLMINFTGEYVNKGQTIAYVYSPELVTAQEELFEAQKIKETQPQLFKSAQEKLKNWKLSDQQIAQMLMSGNKKQEFPVLADVSGYVTEKMVNPGDYIGQGQAIYQVANLSRVWVLFDIYESDMAWVKKGDQITFTVQSLPGENFKGAISFLDPVIDPNTRVARARVAVSNLNLKLKPEMFASGIVEARLAKKTNTVVVPKTAVMWTGKRSVVYIKSNSENGISFIMREVVLGPELGDGYLIESGLQEGEEIAVNGTFSIDAAAQLAGKPSMMNPEGGPAMTGHAGMPGMGGGSSPEKKTSVPTKKVPVGQQAKDALQPLINEYFAMKDALAADDLTKAQKAAANIQTAISKVNMSLFTGASHDVWMGHSSNIGKIIQHVPHLKNIGEVRKSFKELSNVFIGLANSFKPFKKPIYVLNCPKADENKGADWLSLSKDIKNPYLGTTMLKCGSVKETIN